MEAVWAEEVLRERSLSPEGVYRLTLLATGDEVEANAARVKAVLAHRDRLFRSGGTGA